MTNTDDLFSREQRILDDALAYSAGLGDCEHCEKVSFDRLTKEYGRLLKQLRRHIKISDKTTINLNASNLTLIDQVHYDALTNIYNRRFLEDKFESIMDSLSNDKGMLSVLMIDVDFFKKYNDTYGHGMGDECLKRVAKTLQESLKRSEDFVARYGGEEFVVVLPNTDKYGACVLAEKLLENVISCRIPHIENKPCGLVTISIGVTTSEVNRLQSAYDYIKRADAALYTSKQNGRNKFTWE